MACLLNKRLCCFLVIARIRLRSDYHDLVFRFFFASFRDPERLAGQAKVAARREKKRAARESSPRNTPLSPDWVASEERAARRVSMTKKPASEKKKRQHFSPAAVREQLFRRRDVAF